MNEFIKYQHVERIGTTEVSGIENGKCYIFPKIDGTNSSLWYNDDLNAGNRLRELTFDFDNANFYKTASNDDRYIKFFKKYPNLRLFGEWLVPHTIRTYEKTAWNKFYVFDVIDNGKYLTYDEYKPLLEEYSIDYIPVIKIIENPSYEDLINLLDKNTFLIDKEGEIGEGIVIKNYNFVNRYGRMTWGKIVRAEFKHKHKCEDTEIKSFEEKIVDKYVTSAFVEKEFAKIEQEGWNSKMIPRLINTIFHTLIVEETWNFLKEYKNPTIDFKKLLYLTTIKIKETLPQIF